MLPAKKRKLFDEDTICKAVAAVKNGMTYQAAAEKYAMPKSTLCDKVREKYSVGVHRPGRVPLLSTYFEQSLVNFLLRSARIGYGVSKKELPQIVKNALDSRDENIRNSGGIVPKPTFEDNLPSVYWVYRFMKRWPQISSRMPEHLGHQRTYVTEENIRNWFNEFENFLREEHEIVAREFLCEENSHRVFNLDESGFPLAGTNGKLKVITERGTKNVYRVAPDTREQVTVLGCASADGTLQKPFVVFPGVRPNFNFDGVDPDDFDIGRSPNGWMDTDCFFGWLANLFYKAVEDKIQFPILVFMDGHTSHINVAISDFARDKNIILYMFPPHASHLLQPLDVAVYGPLKKYWNDALNAFGKEFRGLHMTRQHFFKVFDKAWKRAVASPTNIKSGFRKTGLVPFNPNAVPYDRLIKRKVDDHNARTINVKPDEKIGMARVIQMFESFLNDGELATFERRLNDGYDLVDDTLLNRMWQFYKTSKTVFKVNSSDADSASTSSQDTTGTTSTGTTSNGSITSNVVSSLSTTCTSTSSTASDTYDITASATSSNIASTSTSDDICTISCVLDESFTERQWRDTYDIPPVFSPSLPLNILLSESSPAVTPRKGRVSYTVDESSPTVTPRKGRVSYTVDPANKDTEWKDYFKVAENIIYTKKFVKQKNPMPPSVSGRSYSNYIWKQQTAKQQALADKEKRRVEREKKKLNMKPKNITDEETSEEEITITYDDESEYDLEDLNKCLECGSSEEQENPDAWMGCSGKQCGNWYHRRCVSEQASQMTEGEVRSLIFYCKVCKQKRQKFGKKFART